MEATFSPKNSSLNSSPYFSPNLSSLLKIKVISWSHKTGSPVTVRVHVANRTFNLHKFPLCSKSGYFRRQLNESTEVKLPANFPGGPETFEMIALFIYGPSAYINPFNVAALRCAAEFLEMTEDHASGNLCERTDLYLNQVAFQSWDDTLIVLQKSQTLLPWAEELSIMSRCVESLAFMVCMEILDPDRKQDRPVMTFEALATRPWCCEMVKEIVSRDPWIKDLIALPFGFFKRIIGSLRRQGMKEKYVSPIIVFYANKRVISKKTNQFSECLCQDNMDLNTGNRVLEIMVGILDLLPTGEKAVRVIDVSFYFSLLARALELGLKSKSRARLEQQIAFLLPFANVEDFLLPKDGREPISSSMELAIMENIFSSYISSNAETNHTPPINNSVIAELWDAYLARVAADPSMETTRFRSLIEKVPSSYRHKHDHLYKALTVFLQAHPNISQEEKESVCKYVNCQKLSQEVCIEAVQNELIPLRLIVQALFVQQLNTQEAFKECSESFRYMHYGEYSGSIPSSGNLNFGNKNIGERPYMDGDETGSQSLSCLLQKDLEMQVNDLSRIEYETTSFRILNLEQELMSLKRSLQLQKSSKETAEISAKPQISKPSASEGRSLSRKRGILGQVTDCTGSLNFASQRRYASWIMKVFHRIIIFGSGKPKRRSDAPGLKSNPV
ncbi:hypothetical protein Nepgr_000586 [Nepenthes gracilis]|uniref:Phototropic-responsive NPH3 family protein n=1 Tax=Nepenthes gracilis TaxID=150966 RepID=A0AAD3P6Z1_NEPGR|nr:hypothetical protein Nepgr_000586 [Nepenthes gracilis]